MFSLVRGSNNLYGWDSLFPDIFDDRSTERLRWGAGQWWTIDPTDKTKRCMSLEVPGFNATNLKVTTTQKGSRHVLVVKGDSGQRHVRQTIELPRGGQPETVKAVTKDGILTLTLSLKMDAPTETEIQVVDDVP